MLPTAEPRIAISRSAMTGIGTLAVPPKRPLTTKRPPLAQSWRRKSQGGGGTHEVEHSVEPATRDAGELLGTVALEVAGLGGPSRPRRRKLCIIDVAGNNARMPQAAKHRNRHHSRRSR